MTKILIVGWRASENLFLDTLVNGLTKEVRVMVVSGTEKGATDVINRMSARFGASRVMPDFEASKPGFSNFISSPEWESFLKAGA